MLLSGMKTLVWSITHFNASQLPPQLPGSASPGGMKGMREEEVSRKPFTLLLFFDRESFIV
jgi:hypothetical protein